MTDIEQLIELVRRALTDKPGSKFSMSMSRDIHPSDAAKEDDQYITGRMITIVIKIEQPK